MGYFDSLDVEYYFTDLYSDLEFIGEGKHQTSKKGYIFTTVDGYLTVKLKGNEYDIMWLNGKNHHQPLDGPAYAAKVKVYSTIYDLMKSAYRFHPIDNDRERKDAAQFLVNKIRQLCKVKRAEVNDV